MKKIFITGVTGYIGGSVAEKLVDRGHQVSGLVRSEDNIATLKKRGIRTVIGSLNQVTLIEEESKKADCIINAADADNSFVVATMLKAIEGLDKTFIHTSGSSLVGLRDNGKVSNTVYHEDMPILAALEKMGRIAIDRSVLEYSLKGVRTIVICPTMIYGTGLGIKKQSIQVPLLIDLAKEKGIAMHVGEGENIWSNVHIDDLAELYVLAMEKAPAGSFFYAENGEASYREIAKTIGESLGYGSETQALDIDEAIERWGPEAAHFAFGANSRVNAEKAKKLLGWVPKSHSICENIKMDLNESKD